MQAYEQIANWPKAHLHLHLLGACPRRLWDQFAPDVDPIFKGNVARDGWEGFVTHYDRLKVLFKQRCDLDTLIEAIVAQAAAESVWYLQPTVSLDDWDAEQVIDLFREHGDTYGVTVEVLYAIKRTDSDAVIMRAAHRAAMLDGVVGMGVVGAQILGRLPHVMQLITPIMRQVNKIVVPHAGESGEPQDVADALDFAPARIAHGIQAVRNVQVLQRLAGAEICLDVCPHSNRMLGFAPGQHPLVQLVAAGVPCSINSDDPLLSGRNLNDEYALVFSWLDQVELVRNLIWQGWQHSGAPVELIAQAATALGVEAAAAQQDRAVSAA